MSESTTSLARTGKPGRPARRRRRPRNADPHASTRVDILKSAAAAFRRLGYHGATVEQIAAALHMKKGNLYYYFRNKEEILFACHQYSLDELHGTALFLDLEAMSPAHLKTIIAGRDRFDHGMRKVLEEGIRSGAFVQADAKLLSFAILGAVNWIPRWYSPDGPASSQEIADRFADYLIAGLRRA